MASAGKHSGLGRKYRLRRSLSFQNVFEGGERVVGRYQVMVMLQVDSDVARVGVVASKRTFRRAVDRARAKRLLRESFRLTRPKLAAGWDIVLIGRRNILRARMQDVRQEFERLVRKGRLYAGDSAG